MPERKQILIFETFFAIDRFKGNKLMYKCFILNFLPHGVDVVITLLLKV